MGFRLATGSSGSDPARVTRLAPLLLLMAAACGPESPGNPAGAVALDASWRTDPSRVASVTAHAFRNPDESRSFVWPGQLDLQRLPELETARITLDPASREVFEAAVLGDHPAVEPAACHIPHHLFVLRDGDEAVVGAIEVCFMCRRVETAPTIPDRIYPDWIALARLCESLQLGLGPAYESAAAFEAQLTEEPGP